MANKQLIQFNADGSVEGLDHKRKGFDLRTLGKAKTVRASEIVWDENSQMWHVHILVGKYKDHILTNQIWAEEVEGKAFLNGKTVFFLSYKDYEDAVDDEVKFLNAIRKKYKKL